jgi:mono/diheme cytochrome c family protein
VTAKTIVRTTSSRAAIVGSAVIWALVSAASGQPVPGSLLDGVYTTAQAARGEETFAKVCTACHAADDLTGPQFRASWGGLTAGDLFDFLSNAMPQNDPGSLTPAEYAGVVAFVLKRTGYPAGDGELPADKAALSRLNFATPPR